MKVTILNAGHCTCSEHYSLQGGRRRKIRFPAMFALIEHPSLGPMLFDTGYSQRFLKETRKFPFSIYRWITPVTLPEERAAVRQLAARGIRGSDITHVFISHFHADHIAGLADFDHARFVYLPQAYASLRGLSGLRALRHAFLPGLLPGDFDRRSLPIDTAKPCRLPAAHAPFTHGYDIFGDQSILAVELPGHAPGQMGLLVHREEGGSFFLVSDAAWSLTAVRENRGPHPVTRLIFPDPEAYRSTLSLLHAYHLSHPEVHLIPSHCSEALEQQRL